MNHTRMHPHGRWQWLALLGLLLPLFWLTLPHFAQAEPVSLHISAVTGTDNLTCGAEATPCQTIQYALTNRAHAGDTLLIAAGTYTENITISISITLMGGYDPVTWVYDPSQYETILDGSVNAPILGAWDERQVRYPMGWYEDGLYHLWYNAQDVGYATSPDGVTWTRPFTTPVLARGEAGTWDNSSIEAPFVLKRATDDYLMWYSGFNEAGECAIGLATSTDGQTWSKHPQNPILSPSTEVWNNVCVIHPFVLYEGGIYKMWFISTGDDGNGQAPVLAYTTSTDGINWPWENAQVVLEQDWEWWFWRPFVRHEGDTYKLWYSVWYEDRAHIAYATAPNETNWTRTNQPIFSGSAGEWDERFVADSFIWHDGAEYQMWYDNEYEIGLASSANGLTWTKSISNPIFSTGTPATIWGEPVVTAFDLATEVTLDSLTFVNGGGAHAGGVSAGSGTTTIRNCLIHHNTAGDGGGGGVFGGGIVVISQSRILHNSVRIYTGGASGIRVGEGSLYLSNSVVADNGPEDAIHLNGTAAITNTTIANNCIGRDRPGINFNPQTGLDLSVTNSILYGNGGGSIHVPNPDDTHVTYSLLQGGWQGTGNLDIDPLFVDGSNGNYQLQAGSPALDAGTNVGAPLFDLLGRPRPRDGNLDGSAVTDMGAYEWQPYGIYLPLITR